MPWGRFTPERVAVWLSATALGAGMLLTPLLSVFSPGNGVWHATAVAVVLAPVIVLGGVIFGVVLSYAVTGQ